MDATSSRRAFRETAFIFDFDGTLLDSGDTKQRAYRAAIASVLDCPDAEVERAYRAYGTLNRVPQLDAAFQDLAGRTPTDPERTAMLAGYSALVDRERHKFVPFTGIPQLLADLHRRSFVAIASNAPQADVEASCSQLGLTAHIDCIYGFPTGKKQAIATVRRLIAVPASAIVYVGDRREDREVARQAGVRFVRFGPLEPDDGTEILRDVGTLASALGDGGR